MIIRKILKVIIFSIKKFDKKKIKNLIACKDLFIPRNDKKLLIKQ